MSGRKSVLEINMQKEFSKETTGASQAVVRTEKDDRIAWQSDESRVLWECWLCRFPCGVEGDIYCLKAIPAGPAAPDTSFLREVQTPPLLDNGCFF